MKVLVKPVKVDADFKGKCFQCDSGFSMECNSGLNPNNHIVVGT